MDDINTGKVKWFNRTKGFGFIECRGKDYFVHSSRIINSIKTLSKGAFVTFKIVDDKKGPMAEEVELMN